ncbi:Thioredoxin reductase [Clostridiales bacterium CHKCI001]|nr:Thioredoxin reductase [Clostridiales bacterium CHKCI001]
MTSITQDMRYRLSPIQYAQKFGVTIPVNEKMETEIPGVYAVGDIRVKQVRQVATAVADGAIAAINAAL